jgi:AmmeMemoRadiSam system protein A
MEGLDQTDGIKLLKVARERISSHLLSRKPNYPEPGSLFDVYRGVFVTLKERGLLRGCIGRMTSRDPLFETIKIMAYAAAFEDPRFVPLAKEELEYIHIELTVLSPMTGIKKESEISLGKHGIYISFQGRTGVFLPQVAIEQGWTREELLEHVCMKAGLPPSAWQDPKASLFTFEGAIFEE